MNKFKALLGFDPKTTTVKTELIAGMTTFLTMCYILAVNPTILATTGMDKGALFTATAIASAIATFLLAFMAKLPFAQAPSMGLNAFFAFTLCQAMGLTWQQALAVLLVEGIIFLAITFLNIRDKILECIPKNLRFAISAGIGMFIAFIGLKNAGIITANADTFVQLGKFTPVSILAPIFLLIPSAATSGALVMVGVLMIDSFKKIELEDISESFPAFITMITMVLCYSIADGICLGILSYVLIKMMVGKFKDLNLTLYILSIFLLFNYVFG